MRHIEQGATEKDIMPWPGAPRFRMENLTGQRRHKLVCLGYLGHNGIGRPLWLCKCDCGGTRTVNGHSFKSGSVKSCGCARRGINLKHGESMHWRKVVPLGSSSRYFHKGTKEYYAWKAIKDRCLNPRQKSFARYGGRGITICSRWRDDFSAFLADVGRAPSKSFSIERIDVNGNYEPGNVCWSSRRQQANNKRNSTQKRVALENGLLSFGA